MDSTLLKQEDGDKDAPSLQALRNLPSALSGTGVGLTRVTCRGSLKGH